jgi:tetratricopeptide (TPR) repeat protein
MKKIVLFLSLICFNFSFGQSNSECKFFNVNAKFLYPNLKYSETAQSFVNSSLNKLNFDNIHISVLIQDNINNCYATSVYGYPLLVLDINWLNNFSTNSDWFHVYVIGHEIGHIVLNHLFNNPTNDNQRQQMELDADMIGGLLLQKYYYPYNSLGVIYPKTLYTTLDNSHPSTRRRVVAVDKVLAMGDKSIMSVLSARSFDINKSVVSDVEKLKSFQRSWNSFSKNPNKANYENCINDISYVFNPSNSDYYLGLIMSIIRTSYAMDIIDDMEFNNKIEHLYSITFNVRILLYKVDLCKNGNWGKDIYDLKFDNRLSTVERQLITPQDKLNYCKYLVYQFSSKLVSKEKLLIWYKSNILHLMSMDDFELRTEFLSISFVLYHLIGDYSVAKNFADMNLKYWQQFELDLYVKNNLSIAYDNLGLIFFRQGIYDSSLINYHIAIGLKNEVSMGSQTELDQIQFQIARCYYHLSQYQKAKYFLDLTTTMDDGFYFYLKGLVYYKSDLKSQAYVYFNKSCTLKNEKSCQALETLY